MKSTLLRVVGVVLLAGFLFAGVTGVAWGEDWKDRFQYLLADGFRMDGYSLVYNPDKKLNFYKDFVAVNQNGLVNTVVEIPAGTNAKFEVTEETGVMSWELKNGKPRLIKYLVYPWNYGMVPRTVGGDGDSLDCLSLGSMELRGTVAQVKIIGVVRLLDGGDQDDKLIAVLPGGVFGGVNSIAELEAQFPGVVDIIKIWLENYKGPGAIVVQTVGEVDEAWDVLNEALEAYNN